MFGSQWRLRPRELALIPWRLLADRWDKVSLDLACHAPRLARISHTTERFLRSALIFSWMANVENAARCRQCASIGVMFSGLREPVCDAARSTRRGDASQTGAARALAAPSRRRAARAHSSAVGQAEAMAMRTRR